MAGTKADMMLEKKLTALHLYPKAARKRLSSRDLTGGSLFSTGRNVKAHRYSDALPPTRPLYHIMPLTQLSIFKLQHSTA